MPLVLSERTQEVLRDLPAYFDDERTIRAILNATTREQERVEALARDIQTQLYPQNVDDTYGFLAMYERQYQLPVSPAGATVDQRRGRLLAFLQTQDSGEGRDWEQHLTDFLGTSSWSYVEGPGYHVTIVIPYLTTSYHAEAVRRYARVITPANLTITITDGVGFILDVSHLDVGIL